MKKLFLLCLISLLLMACSQPNPQEGEVSVSGNETEEVVEVITSTDSQPQSSQDKKNIIPPDDQTVQVAFTQEALDQIALDLADKASRNKVLKIKPAID